MDKRQDTGGKLVIGCCIVVISALFGWFIQVSWSQGTKANNRVTVVETDVAVHDEKFRTIDRRFDTVITKQDSMEGKIDLLLAK